jgi:hypothetical protein
MKDVGEELSRHRLRPVPVALLVAATAVGACCLAALKPIAASLALIPFGALVWLLATRGRDRLTVHVDGFALRRRGKVWRCRWDDVDRVDIRLGDDRRARIHEVTRRDGERIAFARLMGGLDVLYYAYVTRGGRIAPAVATRTGDGIGELLSTHRAERPRGYLPAAVLAGFLLLLALALLYFSLDVPDVDAHDVWASVGCTAAALGFAALLAWLALADRHDELRIHEHGFAYRHRGVVHECPWDALADYRMRHGSVTAVMRDDGTWIPLSSGVPGVREFVAPRVRVAQDHSAPRGRRPNRQT